MQTRSAKKGEPPSGRRPPKYSVLLPTYNDRDNNALEIRLQMDVFEKKCDPIAADRPLAGQLHACPAPTPRTHLPAATLTTRSS